MKKRDFHRCPLITFQEISQLRGLAYFSFIGVLD